MNDDDRRVGMLALRLALELAAALDADEGARAQDARFRARYEIARSRQARDRSRVTVFRSSALRSAVNAERRARAAGDGAVPGGHASPDPSR